MTNADSKKQFSEDAFSPKSNYALFVGKSYGYYAAKWSKILHSKCNGEVEALRKHNLSHVSWNFWAFLFGFAWLSYRKMYLVFFPILSCLLRKHHQLTEHSHPQEGWVCATLDSVKIPVLSATPVICGGLVRRRAGVGGLESDKGKTTDDL